MGINFQKTTIIFCNNFCKMFQEEPSPTPFFLFEMFSRLVKQRVRRICFHKLFSSKWFKLGVLLLLNTSVTSGWRGSDEVIRLRASEELGKAAAQVASTPPSAALFRNTWGGSHSSSFLLRSNGGLCTIQYVLRSNTF